MAKNGATTTRRHRTITREDLNNERPVGMGIKLPAQHVCINLRWIEGTTYVADLVAEGDSIIGALTNESLTDDELQKLHRLLRDIAFRVVTHYNDLAANSQE